MRIFIVCVAFSLLACGETADPVNDIVDASRHGPESQSDESKAEAGSMCGREPRLSEVLELVGQNAHTTPDPWRDLVSQQTKDRFGPLLDFIGNCYKATPTSDSAEQKSDIQFWSLSLGGAVITIQHALEDGSYGGISYIYPAAEPGDFTYVYITSAGFHTQGTIVLNDDQSFTASETVTGHPTITAVRSISRFDDTGLTSMTSEFLDDGEWKPGPAFTHSVTTDPFPRLLPPSPAKTE